MKKRDKAAPLRKTEPPRGVLRDVPVVAPIAPERFHPSADLAPFVEHFWAVTWKLADRPPVRVATLPHPSVHLTFEPGAVWLGGVHRRRFCRWLRGDSFVFGIKFRPASFHAFFGRDLSTLTDRRVNPLRIWGPALGPLTRAVLAAPTTAARVLLAEAFLRARQPQVDPAATALNALVGTIASDRSLTRVDQLCRRFGRTQRQLERDFRRYLGVSPKWVLARYRIHEVLERVHAGAVSAWVDLALELGYADQAHFIRDFKALVGLTPQAYQRRFRPAPRTAV